MADLDQWSCSANEALHIRLKQPDTTKEKDVSFHPAFTYPIFGDEETIFGYQGLKVQLNFSADTLQPSLNVTWKEKFTPVGETKADEILEQLAPFLPTLSNSSAASASNGDSLNEARPFEPPGELLHQYEIKGRTYGIWSTALTDPRAKQILRHMQILVPLFIEGGTLIELDDPDWTIERWTVFFVYAMDTLPNNASHQTYSLVGYSTSYRLFFLEPDSASSFKLSPLFDTIPPDYALPTDTSLTSTLPSRARISQFLILPPHQSSGHGSHLYRTMMQHFLSIPTILQITVEDPNESFDDLRDTCDLLLLRSSTPLFRYLSIPSISLTGLPSQPLPTASILPPITLSHLRRTSKLAPRQLSRILEMQLLSSIPPLHRSTSRITRKDKASDENDRAYYFWRLLVKQRLYKHNYEQLIQYDLEERVQKLEETLVGVEMDYKRILERVERRWKAVKMEMEMETEAGAVGDAVAWEVVQGDEGSAVVNGSDVKRERKRKIVDEDDDGSDGGVEEDVGETSTPRPAKKRPKVIVAEEVES